MNESLKLLKEEFEKAVTQAGNTLKLDEVYQRFFGRKSGELTEIMKNLKDLSGEARKEMGKLVNEVKAELEDMYTKKKETLQAETWKEIAVTEAIDVTQPNLSRMSVGHIHPISQIQREIEQFFASMGFMIVDGPELETDYYNFTALNVPPNHPARDMQDTFYIKDHSDWVMRTQTSPVQVRAMQEYGVPLRMLVPGRVFRNEATDARHEHTFYQVEGMMIDRHISFADMKGVLEALAKHLYGEETRLRFRPKLYPFVEPGVNGEVTCYLCKGAGCRVCKQSGWLEIFGAGMVHPEVLKAGGVDPNTYGGFAFGLGLNRLVMLKYGIEDIRHFMSGDMRFLGQF